MTKLLKYTAIAAVLAATAPSAYADTPTTKGGLTIKSDDGRFEANVGGRIHFDGALLNADDHQSATNEASGFYFRRVFITLKGKAYGSWSYQIDEDISGNGNVGAGFNDVWLAKSFGDNTVYFGQKKPFRSLDEAASNNDILFLERNVLSANGLFGGRDYTNGIYYKYAANGLFIGGSGYSQTKVGKGNTEGSGANVRVAFAPINSEASTLHFGATYSVDQIDNVTSNPGFGLPTAGYSTSYSKSGAAFNVLSMPATTTNAHVDTATIEALGIFGPVFVQGEYGTAKYKDKTPGTAASQKVDAFSVSASYVIFGGARHYKAGDATYGAVKLEGVDGAVEVAVRYDNIKNKDTDAKVNAVTVGANYNVNNNVRFMVDYGFAKAEKTTGLKAGQTDASPKALMARAQIAF